MSADEMLTPSKLDGVMAELLTRGATVEVLGIFTTADVSIALLNVRDYRGYAPFDMTVAEKFTRDGFVRPMGATPYTTSLPAAASIDAALRQLAEQFPQLHMRTDPSQLILLR